MPIKDATVTIAEQQNGPPTGAPITLKFLGDDLEALIVAADKAEAILATIEGTRDISASTKSNATEFVLAIDKAKASNLGVSPLSIGETLRTAVFGTTATTISRNGEDIAIVVKLAVADTSAAASVTPEITIDTLRNLQVLSQNGTLVSIGEVMTEELAASNATIAHEDKKKIVTVTAFTTDGAVSGEIVAVFKKREAELGLPSSVQLSYGGETEDVNQSFTEMFIALVVGLLLMLAILVLSFNSIRYSLYLLLAVPYSLIGVFFGLAATGLALSFTSLLGVIALAGVIINHAIILMDSMITHKASHTATQTLLDSVADAAVSRLRPIVLTTITTVVGMIPLSTISDFWSPLAYAIMFGLTFAMILTLVLVPTLYYRHEVRKVNYPDASET
jgi:hydrophobic/amphiphilic exporter-1 (mainly G- bacteria), HAE1 family